MSTEKWRVSHPGIGTLTYGSEAEARVAAGTAGEVLPPAVQDEQPSLSPAELWRQAGGGTPGYSRERYRLLLIIHGHLVPLPPTVQGGQPSDWRTQTCRCGHPGADHDAGECWAIALDSQCPCSWWEPIPERKTDDDES